jgi:hypothetical protein
MRAAVGFAVMLFLVAAGTTQPTVVHGAQSLLSPAYDVVAGSNVRELGLALQSRALFDPDLAGVTAEELGAWGWTPSETLAVTVWVDGDRFVVRGRDIRPGASTLEIRSDRMSVRSVVPVESGSAEPEAPGLEILSAALTG